MLAATSVCPPVASEYASGYLTRCHSGQFDCLRSLEASSCLEAHHAANWYIAPSHTVITVSVARSIRRSCSITARQLMVVHYEKIAWICTLSRPNFTSIILCHCSQMLPRPRITLQLEDQAKHRLWGHLAQGVQVLFRQICFLHFF